MLQTFKKAITYKQLPFGLPTKYGKVYGWTFHNWKYGYEPETVAFFEKHLTKDDVIADVGASVGFFTALFATLGKKVVAFEPWHPTFEKLRDTVHANMLPNAHIYSCGISDHMGNVPMYATRDETPFNSITATDGIEIGTVDVTTLREMDVLYHFTWAKIDVEGAEIQVLRGLGKTINCVVEAAGARPYFKEIQEMGYDIYPILFGKNGEVELWDGKNDYQAGNLYLKPR